MRKSGVESRMPNGRGGCHDRSGSPHGSHRQASRPWGQPGPGRGVGVGPAGEPRPAVGRGSRRVGLCGSGTAAVDPAGGASSRACRPGPGRRSAHRCGTLRSRERVVMALRVARRFRRASAPAAAQRREQAGQEPNLRTPGSLSAIPAQPPAIRSQVCGRANTQVSNFPTTYITKVSIDLGQLSSGLRIHWNRATPETSALPASFPISPGAGLCSLCCDDLATSHAPGSLCTPKGNSEINRYSCRLGSTAWARDVSFFEGGASRPGIAIHTGYEGTVPPFPASHGCVRTTNQAAAIVFDNSSARSLRDAPPPTQVEVTGAWNGSRCYPSQGGERRSRTAAAALGAGSGSDDLAGPA